MPGRLSDKSAEIAAVRRAGDSMLFDGAVAWTILLPEEDKRMRGASESLDAALADMHACLKYLACDHDDGSEVICAVELAEGAQAWA
jgi:hypothetical protein